MFRLLFLYFTILIFNLFFTVVVNTRFGKALPLSLIALFLTTFICNLLGNLSYYKYVIGSLLLIFIAVIVFIFVKKKNWKESLKRYISPSFIVFTIFYFYFYINSLNKSLTNIDDLSTWSPVVKGIVTTGKFYSNSQTISAYPPYVLWTLSLISYIMGGFSEHVVLFAISVLIISYLIPVFDGFSFRKEDIVKCLLTFLMVIALCLTINIVDGDQYVFAFNSIYLDWIMTAVYAYSFYSVFRFENNLFAYVNFAFLAAALLLTKQVTLPLCMVLVFSLIIRLLITGNLKLKRIIPAIIFLVGGYVLWNMIFVRFSGRSDLFESLKAVKVAFETLFNEDTLKIISDFVSALFTRNIIFHPFKMSYFTFNTIMFVITLVYGYLNGRKKEDYTVSVLFYLGSYGYALVMLISYISKIGDGYSLPLYSRYMQLYTFAYLIVTVYLYLSLKPNIVKTLVMLVAICMFVEPASISTINLFHESSFYKRERELISTYIKDEYQGERVLVIGQTQMGYKGAVAALFNESDKCSFAYPLTLSKYTDMSIETFANYLQFFDLVMITDYDEYFADNYWYKLIDLPLYNSTLYRLTKTEEGIYMDYVYIWEDN